MIPLRLDEKGVADGLAAISNAIYDAVGVRLRDHPMSPPRIVAALAEAEGTLAAE